MEMTTKTGVKVVISEAPFMDAIALKNAICKELAKTGVDVSGINLQQIDINQEVNSSGMKQLISAVMAVDSSSEVFERLFNCLARCKYNGESIKHDTFEDSKAREAYYEIVVACVKVNIAPFLKGLVSLFGQLSPRQESAPQK